MSETAVHIWRQESRYHTWGISRTPAYFADLRGPSLCPVFHRSRDHINWSGGSFYGFLSQFQELALVVLLSFWAVAFHPNFRNHALVYNWHPQLNRLNRIGKISLRARAHVATQVAARLVISATWRFYSSVFSPSAKESCLHFTITPTSSAQDSKAQFDQKPFTFASKLYS